MNSVYKKYLERYKLLKQIDLDEDVKSVIWADLMMYLHFMKFKDEKVLLERKLWVDRYGYER